MYLIISWYLHVRNGVAVAAYSRLASRSQAKFHTKKFSPLVRPCAAAPAQSTTSTHLSLDFRSGAGGWVPGHCYSVPYMKIPANNQVFFIKNVVAVAAYSRVDMPSACPQQYRPCRADTNSGKLQKTSKTPLPGCQVGPPDSCKPMKLKALGPHEPSHGRTDDQLECRLPWQSPWSIGLCGSSWYLWCSGSSEWTFAAPPAPPILSESRV